MRLQRGPGLSPSGREPCLGSCERSEPTLDTSITLMENRARGVEDPPAWPAGDMGKIQYLVCDHSDQKALLHLSHQEKAAEDTECWTSILLHSRCHSPLLQAVSSQIQPASS
ncbi:hypothetical protein J1605_021399 [Eschrichtius robustus]|uniref:Uncharacterized protein n=1 Tax=Eschrichtius robustus TaxID=9764 RepID=A0AB34HBY5_ESCRO|nr:hypothetical protein J1605_021399 [Eschrichtius robustus]